MKNSLKDKKIFRDFCELDINREGIIVGILNRADISHSIISIGQARHIVLFPRNLVNNSKTPVLLAHYDRVDETPGANDNSASVFYLLYHAQRLNKLEHSTVIIFTDREEITGTDSVTDQGAYGLGNYFKSKKLFHLHFFVFDMCGIGTTLLLGTAGENLIKEHYGEKYINSLIHTKIENVKKNAEETLLTVNNGEFFYLTPLFSDDLGLILNKFPAVLISLLPYREAVEYKKNKSKLPKSWLCNHSLTDTIETLDDKSWQVLSPLLSRLSNIPEHDVETNIKDLAFFCYTQTVIEQEITSSYKDTISYIQRSAFDIHKINSSNKKRLEEFLFLSSELKDDAIDYLKKDIEDLTYDISDDIYSYISRKVESEFNLLPLTIRDFILQKSNGKRENIHRYLYNNVISNILNSYYIVSKPQHIKKRVSIIFTEINLTLYNIDLIADDNIVGKLILKKDNNGFFLDSGIFTPEHFVELDPLNMLKGLRSGLIKWLKSNNNDSLRFNLDSYKWRGCYQFYNLINMELEGKTRMPEESNFIYIWKRYYGQQS